MAVNGAALPYTESKGPVWTWFTLSSIDTFSDTGGGGAARILLTFLCWP